MQRNRKRKENAMVIYECDMCGKQFQDKGCVNEITAHVNKFGEETPFDDGLKTFDVCDDCSRLVGEFISGHKSRIRGLRCSVDTSF